MKNFEQYKVLLLNKYKEQNDPEMYERYEHSLNVADMCVTLVERFNLDISHDDAYLCGLLHDYSKFSTDSEYEEIILEYSLDFNLLKLPRKVWHAIMGRYFINRDLMINDENILSAIEFHATGKMNMTPLQEVLFISDFIEKSREGEMFEKAKQIANTSIKEAVFFILKSKIDHIKKRGLPLDNTTLQAYNYYKKYRNINELNKVDAVLECINKNLVSDVCIYDVSNRSPLYDYVIIASASSSRQMEACISYLRDDFVIRGSEISSEWTLIDLNDIIIHIFSSDSRERFGLDKLYIFSTVIENKVF